MSNGIDGISTEYVLSINEKLAEEVSFLRDQVRSLMAMNQQLLDKVTNVRPERAPVVDHDFQPIGGYKSLRTKIEEAEQDSRIEVAKKEVEDAS